MKFMSNTAVFIVIAAFAACAAGAEISKQIGNNRARRSSDGDSAEEAAGALRLRLRGCACGPNGCMCSRFKREDLATLDAALGVYEDGDEQTGDSLRLRLRGGCACGPNGCLCSRFKREDLATLDAALSVYEDAATVGDNVESAGEEQTGDSLRLRLRGCSCGPFGCSCTRFKREDLATLDAVLGVYEDGDEQTGDSLRLRLRGCSCGPCGCSCTRLKREDISTMDAALGVYEDGDEQTGDSLRLRLRGGCFCGKDGCGCSRLKREDLATLDAAMGVYEDGDEQTGDSLRLRLRGGCFCGPHGCGCNRLKREDLAVLDAAMGVYEDGASLQHRLRRWLSGNHGVMTGDGRCGPYGCTTGGDSHCDQNGCVSN